MTAQPLVQGPRQLADLLFRDVHVLDPRAPPRDRSAPRANVIDEPHVAPEHVAPPAIVIAGDPQQLDAALAQIGQGREDAKASARNHRPPLEPEIEEIAVDDDSARVITNVGQKRQQRALDGGRGRAKVRIRDHVARTGEDIHAWILAVARAPG